MAEAPDEILAGDDAAAAQPAEAPVDGYQVRLDVFEGPLDLLLFLIRKKKIDIHDIPIAAITRDYLGSLARKTEINLDREAEFVFVAALLIYIKSQMLLPRETDLAETEDPRRVLVDRLLEYEKVRAACSILREREDVQILQWKRDFIPPLSGEGQLEPVELSLFDLAESFFRMMKRREADDTRIIRGREVPIEVKMKELVTLLQERHVLDFLEYFEASESLEEALVSFFCILELVKSRVAVAVQDELFQTIRVWLRKDPHRTAAHERRLEGPRRIPHLRLPGAGDAGRSPDGPRGRPGRGDPGRRRRARPRRRGRRPRRPRHPGRRRLALRHQAGPRPRGPQAAPDRAQEPAVFGRPRDPGGHRLPPARDPVGDLGHPRRGLVGRPEDAAREGADQDRRPEEGPGQSPGLPDLRRVPALPRPRQPRRAALGGRDR